MLPIIVALLFQLSSVTENISAQLVAAVPANHPPNAVAGTCVLADVAVDSQGKIAGITILQGMGPFNDSATRAIKQWKFSPAIVNGRLVASKVGVLTVFRPPTIGNSNSGGPSLGYKQPMPSDTTHPPLPVAITDPGYPQNSTSSGMVIIEVHVGKTGVPSNIRTVQGVPALTAISQDAIRSWKFIPAEESGRPIDGTLVVAISFIRPI